MKSKSRLKHTQFRQETFLIGLLRRLLYTHNVQKDDFLFIYLQSSFYKVTIDKFRDYHKLGGHSLSAILLKWFGMATFFSFFYNNHYAMSLWCQEKLFDQIWNYQRTASGQINIFLFCIWRAFQLMKVLFLIEWIHVLTKKTIKCGNFHFNSD